MDESESWFGKRLKEAREKLGITQEQLAERMGYTKQSVSLVETGATRRPSLDFAKKAEKALGEHGKLLYRDASGVFVLTPGPPQSGGLTAAQVASGERPGRIKDILESIGKSAPEAKLAASDWLAIAKKISEG
jgi:transcriptional regulator with XRE-family HTH domain